MYWRLSRSLSKERGRATKSPRPVRTTILRLAVASIPANLETMGGPRSPMTTKKAMAVPARYPMIPNSTRSFPVCPCV